MKTVYLNCEVVNPELYVHLPVSELPPMFFKASEFDERGFLGELAFRRPEFGGSDPSQMVLHEQSVYYAQNILECLREDEAVFITAVERHEIKR